MTYLLRFICPLVFVFMPNYVAPSVLTIADAVMLRDHDGVRSLLKSGADVNASQGDGMTALHWAASLNDVDTAQMLLYAGANVRATTRLGGYSPLMLASKGGNEKIVAMLLAAGSEVNLVTNSGTTSLMMAAASGSRESVSLLLVNGSDLNAKESHKGQTALMFAAASNHVATMEVLLEQGADVSVVTNLIDFTEREKKFREKSREKANMLRKLRNTEPTINAKAELESENNRKEGKSVFRKIFGWLPWVDDARPDKQKEKPRSRRTSYGQLVGVQGGLTPLLLASRQGHVEAVKVLLDAGADLNYVTEGNSTGPLLVAIMNGHYDLANYLLEKGANANKANIAGVTPLYATINNWYAPRTSHPQPTAHKQQRISHLVLMEALLKKGADPNARLKQKIWFSAYNFDQSGVDETGATPFWRAAYASDVATMQLLFKYGADPNLTTKKPPERPRIADENPRELQDVSGVPPVPEGGPALTALHAATGAGYGEGFASNEHRNHPAGWMPAVRYLIEEIGANVNARDHEGNTPLHNAAARGDVEMIEYLVSKGADVTLVNREGQTTADMSNGPVQRIQPFPEALELLVSMGARNSNKCVSC